MDLLLQIHSLLRWLILLVILAALIRLGFGWARRLSFGSLDNGLLRGFAWAMSIQAVLGILLLFGSLQIGHALPMVLAVGLAHMSGRWRQPEIADPARFRNSFLAVLGVLLLIVLGLAALPGS